MKELQLLKLRLPVGIITLLAFIIVGYGPAMFCRDIILIGYSAPANHDEVVRYVASIAVGIVSMAIYATFAWVLVLPHAKKRFAYPARMTGDQKRDIDDKRFFFCLIPWLVIVVGYAMWDMGGGASAPSSEAIMQWAMQLTGTII